LDDPLRDQSADGFLKRARCSSLLDNWLLRPLCATVQGSSACFGIGIPECFLSWLVAKRAARCYRISKGHGCHLLPTEWFKPVRGRRAHKYPRKKDFRPWTLQRSASSTNCRVTTTYAHELWKFRVIVHSGLREARSHRMSVYRSKSGWRAGLTDVNLPHAGILRMHPSNAVRQGSASSRRVEIKRPAMKDWWQCGPKMNGVP